LTAWSLSGPHTGRTVLHAHRRGGELSPEAVKESELAGERITAELTRARAITPIGGLEIIAARGWFAARPSGTEVIYKIYAESFKDKRHLDAIVSEAQAMVSNALSSSEADHTPARIT
jgi:phosphoglucomutase